MLLGKRQKTNILMKPGDLTASNVLFTKFNGGFASAIFRNRKGITENGFKSDSLGGKSTFHGVQHHCPC